MSNRTLSGALSDLTPEQLRRYIHEEVEKLKETMNSAVSTAEWYLAEEAIYLETDPCRWLAACAHELDFLSRHAQEIMLTINIHHSEQIPYKEPS